MHFLGRILRFLFWFLVISCVVKLLSRLIGGTKAKSTPVPGDAQPISAAGKRLVRDPVCGIHMAEELALPLNTGGEILHFCSDECRRKYEGSMLPRAQSA